MRRLDHKSYQQRTMMKLGNLYSGFNKAVENIREMLEQVIQTVESTASASSQISSSTEELASGAQEQSMTHQRSFGSR